MTFLRKCCWVSSPREREMFLCALVLLLTSVQWFLTLCNPMDCAAAAAAKSLQSCPTLCDPIDGQPTRFYSSWEFSRHEHWSRLPCPPPGDLFNPGIEPRSPALQAVSLPSELQGKPKNTGAGSLFLLQGNFLTQELNQGLLHCRQILFQLSHQGSP